jgi:hypothetical protein
MRDSARMRMSDDRRESCGFPLQLAYSKEANNFYESPRMTDVRLKDIKVDFNEESISINKRKTTQFMRADTI